MEIVKIENVKTNKEFDKRFLDKSIVWVFDETDKYEDARAEVVSKKCLTEYYNAIDKDELVKDIATKIWRLRGDDYKYVSVELNPSNLDINMYVENDTYVNVYKQLHLVLFTSHFNIDTLNKYSSLEEFLDNCYDVINDYTECFEDCIDDLYRAPISENIKNDTELKVRDYNGENEVTVSVISKENIISRYKTLDMNEVAEDLASEYDRNLGKDGLYVAVLSTVVANVVEFRYYEPGVVPKYPNLQIVLCYIDTLEEKEMIGNDLEGKVVVETNCEHYVYEQIDKLYGSN